MHSTQEALRIDVAASISGGMPVIHFNDGGSLVQTNELGETAGAGHPYGERRMPVPQALLTTGIVVTFSATALAVAPLLRLHAVTGGATLGTDPPQLARAADGTIVQGFAFIHYKKDFARPEKPSAPKPPKADSCYTFLSPGAKWKVAEPYVFDEAANNIDTLPFEPELLIDFESAISAWEIAAGKDILGGGSLGVVFPNEVGTLNERNEVMFGEIAEPGVLAMTIVWGDWSGPPSRRQLVEWDMVFGTGWAWGDELTNPDSTLTDFLNNPVVKRMARAGGG